MIEIVITTMLTLFFVTTCAYLVLDEENSRVGRFYSVLFIVVLTATFTYLSSLK